MNHLKTQKLSITYRQSKTRLAQVDKQIAEIDRLINATNTLAHSMKILRSIPGIGAVCATTILIEMLEIGKPDRRQVASLTGLVPMARQSGQWRGKSSIQGGRKIVRDGFYMPALITVRYKPDFKAKYQAMIKAGKPAKVTITALIRKLIELANALIKADRIWVIKEA